MDVQLFGTVLAFVNLLVTGLISVLFGRNRKLAKDSKRLGEIEPKYLEALDYGFRWREWAAQNGYSKRPGIPQAPAGMIDNHTGDGDDDNYAAFLEWKKKAEGPYGKA